MLLNVSTHSRLKAAGNGFVGDVVQWLGFNTQPPEGGWLQPHLLDKQTSMFQHTAA